MPPDGPSYDRVLDYPLTDRQGFGSTALSPNAATGVSTVTIDDDGSVTIKTGAPEAKRRTPSSRFNENLALKATGDLGSLAQEILDGVDADLASRKGWIDNFTDGLDLLGLTIEESRDSKQGPASKIGHPLLLGAVVKAQSAASAELMPSRGPCKVTTRDGDDAGEDEIAQALERDMNWYLTTGAPEYYPDTDRALFGLMFSGNCFRKVYEHPVRRRPVSDAIAVEDLIVSEAATDLDTAVRVTHRAEMSRSEVKRMQWMGVWRDAMLPNPMPSMDAADRKKDEITGTSPMGYRPQDIPFTIYETTIDLILADYGLEDPLPPDDLPVSYAVTIDKDSRQILDIRRRWKDGDPEYQRKSQYVHYGMIPALGFLCLGHLHLLGNQTKALRAIWRILVTAGMYSNAPAGIRAKNTRTSTNEINPMPGEWVDLDIGVMNRVQDAFMALPYKDPSAVFIQLADMIGKESGQLSSAADVPMGDSRVDVPVGTILAMIEQATQMASSIHKRLYRAQARELQLLKECFAENPESLWKLNKKPARQWQAAEEFADIDLVPASDPNVPSQIHRIMLASAMVMMASQNPDIYDRVTVHERAWKSIGVNDAESFLHQPTPQPGPPGAAPPDPLIGQAKMLEAQARLQKVQADLQDMQRKAATEAVESRQQDALHAMDHQARAAELASEERIQVAKLAVERERLNVEHLRAAAQHDLAMREAAAAHARAQDEHELAIRQHHVDRQHTSEELSIKRKVADKPTPKPAARKS